MVSHSHLGVFNGAMLGLSGYSGFSTVTRELWKFDPYICECLIGVVVVMVYGDSIGGCN